MRLLSVLRLPLLALALIPSTWAVDRLYSDRAAYCATPNAVLINDFSVTYHRPNNSLVFYISLNSTEPGVNVDANVFVSAYGMDLLNRTLDLCSLLGGILCPLPQLNVSAYGSVALPSDIDIPAIAFSVPNLEAWARITLRQPNGTDALCIQTTLTNGLTTEHLSIKIVTGVFTAIALIIGLIHSAANTASPAQYRWFDILFLFQAAAATGLMNLNYPLMYRAFTRNFAWAFALFRSDGMQRTINDMRFRTGGYINGSLTEGVQYIDRSDPYNRYLNVNDIAAQLQALAGALAGLGGGGGGIFGKRQSQLTGTAVTPSTSSILSSGASTDTSGVAIYTNSVGVPYPNAMTTIFFFFLAFIGIFLFVHAIFFLVSRIGGRSIWAQDLRRKFWLWMAGNALLTCLMWSFPIWIFAFYQFRIGDSRLAIFWGAFSIALTFLPLLFVFIFSLIRSRRRSSASPGVSFLYTSYNWFHSAGALYRAYRQRFHWFWFVFVLAIIGRAGFIAFGPLNGWAQVIGNVVIESIVLIALLVCRPHKDRKGDWLSVFLSFCRLAAFGLLIAFIRDVNVAPIPRTIIGFVIIVLFAIPVVFLFLGLLYNLGYGWLWRRHDDRIEDGLEVQRYVASDDSSLRPAMAQMSNPVTPRDSVRMSSDQSMQRRTSLMEPVSNVYEPRNRAQEYYNDPVDPSSAYAEASRGGRLSAPPSRASTPGSRRRPMSTGTSTRTGQSQYFTPMDEDGPTPDYRRWSRDQYFDTTTNNNTYQNSARY